MAGRPPELRIPQRPDLGLRFLEPGLKVNIVLNDGFGDALSCALRDALRDFYFRLGNITLDTSNALLGFPDDFPGDILSDFFFDGFLLFGRPLALGFLDAASGERRELPGQFQGPDRDPGVDDITDGGGPAFMDDRGDRSEQADLCRELEYLVGESSGNPQGNRTDSRTLGRGLDRVLPLQGGFRAVEHGEGARTTPRRLGHLHRGAGHRPVRYGLRGLGRDALRDLLGHQTLEYEPEALLDGESSDTTAQGEREQGGRRQAKAHGGCEELLDVAGFVIGWRLDERLARCGLEYLVFKRLGRARFNASFDALGDPEGVGETDRGVGFTD